MDMDNRLRLLYMAQLLYDLSDEDHYLSTSQLINLLSERYGISSHRQTIKRDIEVLQRFGCDIKELKSTQNLYHLVSRKFDTAELRLLIDAVCSAKFITARKSEQLVEKISSLAGINEARALKENCCLCNINRADNEQIYIIIDSINEAIKRRRKISFQYYQYDIHKEKVLRNSGVPYVVSPIRLVWNGDHYYLLAIKDSGERRNFRVDRIASTPDILSSAANPTPEGFDVNEYLNQTIRMYDAEPRNVTLKCDNSVIGSILDYFGTDVPIVLGDDGTFTARVKVSVSNVFFGRVFGYGGLIKIIEPEDVKQKFRLMLKNFD